MFCVKDAHGLIIGRCLFLKKQVCPVTIIIKSTYFLQMNVKLLTVKLLQDRLETEFSLELKLYLLRISLNDSLSNGEVFVMDEEKRFFVTIISRLVSESCVNVSYRFHKLSICNHCNIAVTIDLAMYDLDRKYFQTTLQNVSPKIPILNN